MGSQNYENSVFLQKLDSQRAKTDYNYLIENFCDTIENVGVQGEDQISEMIEELNPPLQSYRRDAYINSIKKAVDDELDKRYAHGSIIFCTTLIKILENQIVLFRGIHPTLFESFAVNQQVFVEIFEHH